MFSMQRLRLADLEIDRGGRCVCRNGQPLPVRDRSFALLEALLDKAPATVSHSDLFARVWGNSVVCRETLSQRVRLLRKELGGDTDYIRSVHGQGYGLIASPVDFPTLRPTLRLTLTLATAALLLAMAGFLVLQNTSSSGQHAQSMDVHAAKHAHD